MERLAAPLTLQAKVTLPPAAGKFAGVAVKNTIEGARPPPDFSEDSESSGEPPHAINKDTAAARKLNFTDMIFSVSGTKLSGVVPK